MLRHGVWETKRGTKIVNLLNERKGRVAKIKGLIPKTKGAMRRRENMPDARQCLEHLNAQLCENATTAHTTGQRPVWMGRNQVPRNHPQRTMLEDQEATCKIEQSIE